MSVVAPGGTVFSLSADARGTCWLATESGLWRGTPGAWQPLAAPMPLAHTAALLAVPSGRSDAMPLLIAGGAPASIATSADGGASWHAAHADASDSPVTCLAASPRFAADRVLLAGTAGAGMLRSTDGGRWWRLANAGLHEFDALALATAPAWGAQEVAFAVTTSGIYRSPNGGRFWKHVASFDENAPLQALAISPAFAEDGTVYAGGEPRGVVRSVDGGRTWQPVAAGDSQVPDGINCLWMPDARTLLAGTFDGAIYRSTDGGARWDAVASDYGALLALGTGDGMLHAGMYDEGLLVSTDSGATWQRESQFAARDITRLAVDASGVLAWGPSGGAWRAQGDYWQRLPLHADAAPLTTLLELPDGGMLIGTTAGLLALDSRGNVADPSLPASAAVTTLARHGAEVWAGTAGGALWRSTDGQPWQHGTTLAEGQVITALACGADKSLVAATVRSGAQHATLWRSEDGGTTWARWLEQPSGGARAQLCLAQDDGAASWAAIGSRVWRWHDQTWQPFALGERPLIALQRWGDTLVAASDAAVFRWANDAGWERMDIALPPGGLLDLAVTPDGQLIGLGRGGQIVTVSR